MKRNVWQMFDSYLCMQTDLEQDNGCLVVLVLNRSGLLSVKRVHKEEWDNLGDVGNWQKADIQFSVIQVHCPEVDSKAQVTENVRYYCADCETVESICRENHFCKSVHLSRSSRRDVWRIRNSSRQNGTTRCERKIEFLVRAKRDQDRSVFRLFCPCWQRSSTAKIWRTN